MTMITMASKRMVDSSPSGLATRQIWLPKIAGRRRHIRFSRFYLPFILPLLTLLAWDMTSRFGLISPLILPPPEEVLDTGLAMVQSGEIIDAVRVSLVRVFIGFSLGAMVGIAVGGAMGLSRSVEAYLGPTVRII
ncbi:MAG: hypothetical protein ABWY00_05340, partial [Dongiaceae bacterium]